MLFRSRALGLQDDLLHSPGRDLGDEKLIFITAIDFMDSAEISELLTGVSKLTQYRSVQLHFVNLAGYGRESAILLSGLEFEE